MLEVMAARRPERPSLGALVDNTLWSLVERCWAQDPADRPTTTSICTDITSFTETSTACETLSGAGTTTAGSQSASMAALSHSPPIRARTIETQHTISDGGGALKVSVEVHIPLHCRRR
jgi:hypothetical protein